MDSRLTTPFLALRVGLGLTATLAGIDKFFNCHDVELLESISKKGE